MSEKVCPLLGMVVEEGRPSPVGCYGSKCALWDKRHEWCRINTIADALQVVSLIMEGDPDG